MFHYKDYNLANKINYHYVCMGVYFVIFPVFLKCIFIKLKYIFITLIPFWFVSLQIENLSLSTAEMSIISCILSSMSLSKDMSSKRNVFIEIHLYKLAISLTRQKKKQKKKKKNKKKGKWWNKHTDFVNCFYIFSFGVKFIHQCDILETIQGNVKCYFSVCDIILLQITL